MEFLKKKCILIQACFVIWPLHLWVHMHAKIRWQHKPTTQRLLSQCALVSSCFQRWHTFRRRQEFLVNFIRLNAGGGFVTQPQCALALAVCVYMFLLPLQLIYTHFFAACIFPHSRFYSVNSNAVCVQVCVHVFECVRAVHFPIKLWSIFSILLWQLLWDHYVLFLKPFPVRMECTKRKGISATDSKYMSRRQVVRQWMSP